MLKATAYQTERCANDLLSVGLIHRAERLSSVLTGQQPDFATAYLTLDSADGQVLSNKS